MNNAALTLSPEDRADEMKSTALYYRQCGLSVIPVRGRQYTFGNTEDDRERNSKRPLLEWAPYQKIFASEEEIEEWSTRWPFANLACVTGQISGIVVVDFDSEDAVRAAASRGYLNTVIVTTERGCHAYYRYPQGKEIRNNVDGNIKTDIRANGGYVILPPSIHYSGRHYVWKMGHGIGEVPFADMPAEFLIESSRKTCRGRSDLHEFYKGVGRGKRNDTLARLCGSWINDGLDDSECLMMAQTWNTINTPPLPDREVVSVVESILRYRRLDRGHATEMFTPETNIFTLPLFSSYEKRVGKPGMVECRVPCGEMILAVTTHAGSHYGLGGAFDERIFWAVFEMAKKLSVPVKNPVNIGTLGDIARLASIKDPSTDDIREIARSLRRIAAITVDARLIVKNRVYLETLFHIFDVLFKSGKDEGSGSHQNLVYISPAVIKMINAGYLAPIDNEKRRPLTLLARFLYNIIVTRHEQIIPYREVCERLGLIRQVNGAEARNQLMHVHAELQDKGIIMTAKWRGWDIEYHL